MNTDNLISLRFYEGEEHKPFQWISGNNAALLIHGFPGTPAEMRMLAQALYGDSWSVHGILLPGFGQNIRNLEHVTVEDWLESIGYAIEALANSHDKVVLVGNSLGAALSILSAKDGNVDGLVLLSPFLRIHNFLVDTVFPILPFLKRNIQPFEKANFEDPQVREAIERFLPDADFDDDDVLNALRLLPLPLTAVAQVRKAGRLASRLAPKINVPSLVLQGTQDELVHSKVTRALANKLPWLAGYVEVNGGHNLLVAEGPVRESVHFFTRSFLHQLNYGEGAV